MSCTFVALATLVVIGASGCGSQRVESTNTADPAVLAAIARLNEQVDRLGRHVAQLQATGPVAHNPGTSHGSGSDPRQDPQQAFSMLQKGNLAFLRGGEMPPDLSSERRQLLAKGQKPYAIIVGCSDSRCPPEHVFQAGIGDLFIVRTAGNVISDEALASVEYAVAHLGCRLVVCLGHSQCGAVKAAIAGVRETPAVGVLIDHIRPAVDEARASGQSGEGLVNDSVDRNVVLAKKMLTTRSALLRERLDNGQIRLVVGRQELADGVVTWLDADGLGKPQKSEAHSTQQPAPLPSQKPAHTHAGHGH